MENREKEFFATAIRTFQELFLELGSVDTRLSEKEEGKTLLHCVLDNIHYVAKKNKKIQ